MCRSSSCTDIDVPYGMVSDDALTGTIISAFKPGKRNDPNMTGVLGHSHLAGIIRPRSLLRHVLASPVSFQSGIATLSVLSRPPGFAAIACYRGGDARQSSRSGVSKVRMTFLP